MTQECIVWFCSNKASFFPNSIVCYCEKHKWLWDEFKKKTKEKEQEDEKDGKKTVETSSG